MITYVFDFIAGGLFRLLAALFGLLPRMDLPDMAGAVASSGAAQWLGWLNWLFPVGTAAAVTLAWAGCLILYNAYLAFSGWLGSLHK